jgi:hypothetical protein
MLRSFCQTKTIQQHEVPTAVLQSA